MARLVYGCRFEIPGPDAWADVVAPTYADWIRAWYEKGFGARVEANLHTGEVIGNPPERHDLAILRHTAEGEAVDCRWTFLGENGLRWRNAIHFGALSDRCAVEHRVELESADYLLAPARFSVGAPGVIRDICERYEVFVGSMRIRAVVYPLTAGSADEFVTLLQTDLRRLPIVLVTPFANGESSDLGSGPINSLADCSGLIQWRQEALP